MKRFYSWWFSPTDLSSLPVHLPRNPGVLTCGDRANGTQMDMMIMICADDYFFVSSFSCDRVMIKADAAFGRVGSGDARIAGGAKPALNFKP